MARIFDNLESDRRHFAVALNKNKYCTEHEFKQDALT